jgi:hypothetical protein
MLRAFAAKQALSAARLRHMHYLQVIERHESGEVTPQLG